MIISGRNTFFNEFAIGSFVSIEKVPDYEIAYVVRSFENIEAIIQFSLVCSMVFLFMYPEIAMFDHSVFDCQILSVYV